VDDIAAGGSGVVERKPVIVIGGDRGLGNDCGAVGVKDIEDGTFWLRVGLVSSAKPIHWAECTATFSSVTAVPHR